VALERKDVENIAHLARLAISEADIPEYARNLSNILALVEQMSAVDTAGVHPMAHPLDATQRLREDAVTETDQRDHFQAIAPPWRRGCIWFPR